MEKQIEYKGYEVLAIQNKRIVAQIKSNLFMSEKKTDFGNKLYYEPPTTFKFNSYDSMVKFIDKNPR